MSRQAKTLEKVLSGRSDANIKFADLRHLLELLGFTVRIRGDHHIFTRDGVVEILNLQPRNAEAKPYQVRQVRGIITSYGLAGGMTPTPDVQGQTQADIDTGEAANEG